MARHRFDLSLTDMIVLLDVIGDVHSQHADDLCWMDIDRIFVAAGLPIPDRRVGDKEAMHANCRRFIDTMCAGGKWKSYSEQEREITALRAQNERLRAAAQLGLEVIQGLSEQQSMPDDWYVPEVEKIQAALSIPGEQNLGDQT